VASDLAFLAMDFDYQGRPHCGSRMMERYARMADDPGAYLLLPLYKCYRAMVRCKVSCLQLQAADAAAPPANMVAAAQRYLELAYRYAVSFSRPKIWAFSGLPASGKSTVARALSRSLEADHYRSDALRHTISGHRQQAPQGDGFNAGIYGRIPKQRTYNRLLDKTRSALDRGRSVVVDATFNRPEYRREIKRLARDRHLRLTFVECRAPLHVIETRLRRREQHPGLSQARHQNFKAFRQHFVPLGGAGMTAHIVVDTTRSPDECVRHILAEDHRVSTACMLASLREDCCPPPGSSAST
jgi:predicted kinase